MLYDVTVDLGDRSYDIHIGAGLLGQIGDLCAGVGLKGKCLIITDENVGGHYAEAVFQSLEKAGFAPSVVTLPPGEKQLLRVGYTIELKSKYELVGGNRRED